MICPKCGLDASGDANFCNHCGAPLNAQGKSLTADASPAAIAATAGAAGVAFAPTVNRPMMPQSAERVIWEEYPSLRVAFPATIAWLALGIGLYVVVRLVLGESRPPWIGITILSVTLGLVVLNMLRMIVKLRSVRYKLSSQRIFVTTGIINKRTEEIELEKYKDVFVYQNFLDKVVGCGDIEMVTGDISNQTVKILDVQDPVGKKESIRTAARERKNELGITRREEI